MALMLLRLHMVRSAIMSASVMARPRRASNSWRSAPLNTMRLPLSVMMPSTMAKRRKPNRCGTTSMISPESPVRVIVSVYRRGSSALQGSTAASAVPKRIAAVPIVLSVNREPSRVSTMEATS